MDKAVEVSNQHTDCDINKVKEPAAETLSMTMDDPTKSTANEIVEVDSKDALVMNDGSEEVDVTSTRKQLNAHLEEIETDKQSLPEKDISVAKPNEETGEIHTDQPQSNPSITDSGDVPVLTTSNGDQKEKEQSTQTAGAFPIEITIEGHDAAIHTHDKSDDTPKVAPRQHEAGDIAVSELYDESPACIGEAKALKDNTEPIMDSNNSNTSPDNPITISTSQQTSPKKSQIEFAPKSYYDAKQIVPNSTLRTYPHALPPATPMSLKSDYDIPAAIRYPGNEDIMQAVADYPRSVGYDQVLQFSHLMASRNNPQIWLPGRSNTTSASGETAKGTNNNNVEQPDLAGDSQNLKQGVKNTPQVTRGTVTEEGDQGRPASLKQVHSDSIQASNPCQIDSGCLASSSSGIPSMSTFSISLADSDDEEENKPSKNQIRGACPLNFGPHHLSATQFFNPPSTETSQSEFRPAWFKTQEINETKDYETDEEKLQQRGKFFRGHFDRLERVGLLVSPSSQNISIYSPATHPMLFITPAGLLTVLLKREVAVEMTLDQTLRLVNFRHRAAAATDKRGTASFIFHAAARMHQERTTMEAELFNQRRVKMTTGKITFSNGPDCYSMSPYGLLHDNLQSKDLSKDLTVSLLYSSSGYGPHLIPRFCELAKSANYIFHKRGAVTVLVNGTRIYQNGRGDVMVYCGRKYLRASPDTGAMHIATHFVEMAVETNWRVRAKRGDQRMSASFQNMLVSDSFREAGFEQNGRLIYQPVVLVKETLIDNRPPAAAAGDLQGGVTGRAPDQVLYDSRTRRSRWTNRRRAQDPDALDEEEDENDNSNNDNVYVDQPGCIRLETQV